MKYSKTSKTKFGKKGEKKPVPKSVKTYVKRTLAATIEDKYVDSIYASYQPTYTFGWITQLTPPAQGLGSNQRIGDKIRPTKIQVCGQMYGANSHVIRLILFRWHANTVPTGGQVLDGTYATSYRAPFAPYADSTKSMYTILKDKMLVCSASGVQNVPFKFNIGRKKLANIEFAPGAATGTQLIYVLMVQDGTVTLDTIDSVMRLWYEDA